MTARLPATAARSSDHYAPDAALPYPQPMSDSPVMPSLKTLMSHVMRVAQIAVFDAIGHDLQLISFQCGASTGEPFGLSARQVAAGSLWTENIYPPDRDGLRAHIGRSTPLANSDFFDYRIIIGEGELLWVRHWVLDRSPTGNAVVHFLNLIMPIPEQKHLEWECLRVSERECNRIGQELHDDLCQVLAGLAFMMRVVSQHARRVDPALAAEIDEFNTHLAGATDRVRSMAHGLFPAQLKYSTVQHALTAFAAEARVLFRIELTIALPKKLPRHTPEMIVHVYRIAQEAVSNAVRHGKATSVRIALATNPKGVVMRVEDNGQGLPEESKRPEGIGMHVMKYRARVLGGTFNIENLLPHGVIATLAYPVAHPTTVLNSESPTSS